MMPFWKIAPSLSRKPSPATRACSSSQMRSSGQLSTESFGIALEVHALHVGRAGRDQREAALVVGVDQLVRGRRRLGQDAEPAERIDPEVVLAHAAFRNGRAADAVAAVAAGDEVAGEFLVLALLGGEADLGLVGGHVLQAGRLGLEQDLAARLKPELDQVLEHLVLGVDRDRRGHWRGRAG